MSGPAGRIARTVLPGMVGLALVARRALESPGPAAEERGASSSPATADIPSSSARRQARIDLDGQQLPGGDLVSLVRQEDLSELEYGADTVLDVRTPAQQDVTNLPQFPAPLVRSPLPGVDLGQSEPGLGPHGATARPGRLGRTCDGEPAPLRQLLGDRESPEDGLVAYQRGEGIAHVGEAGHGGVRGEGGLLVERQCHQGLGGLGVLRQRQLDLPSVDPPLG